MGCGGSKMNPEREAVASKFPPRLRHKFEEIKRRRNAAAMKGTLSKKELLKEGDASHDSADDKSPSPSSSSEESLRAARIAPEPEPTSIKEEDNNNAALEEENIVEKEGQDEQESEEGRFGNVGVGYVCPGSPSFRVYCAEALEPINNDILTDKDDIATEEKPRREDSGEIVSSMNSNEGSSKGLEVNTRDKAEKEKKVKRLRKRKSNPVKKLLNVKSCYCNGGHHNNARLLSQKTVA